MKKNFGHNSSKALRHFFLKSGIRVQRLTAIILAFAILNLGQGCYYLKVNTKTQPDTALITSLQDKGKVFFIHYNDKTWRMGNMEFVNNELKGDVREMDKMAQSVQVNPDRPNRYLKRASNNQSYLLNEVHLWVDEYVDQGNSQIAIPAGSIRKVEVYDRDTATTAGSWMMGAVGVGLGVFVILLILVAIFKESCPFIYTFDGEKYTFNGEIFSGAIQPGLERHDYLRLRELKPVDGFYQVKVTNEIREIQHINLMELQVIDHPADVGVLSDKYGNVYTLSKPLPPVAAETYTGKEALTLVGMPDSVTYQFNDVSNTGSDYDGLVLTFTKPAGISHAKLLIKAKNSIWVEHVFSSFHNMFGSMYNAFDRKEAKRPAEELRALMISQGFPLSVSVEKDGNWEVQDFYEVAGPMMMKDDILSLNLEGIDSDTFRVKLETGFMFWELDQIAIDYSENVPFRSTTISASNAPDENGTDVAGNLRYDDESYYIQPEIGNEAVLRFPVPEQTGENRTVILHSKGYYKIIREQAGRADWKTLRTFRDPGRMPQYSRELFEKFMALSQE
jgi:hypothetical protein